MFEFSAVFARPLLVAFDLFELASAASRRFEWFGDTGETPFRAIHARPFLTTFQFQFAAFLASRFELPSLRGAPDVFSAS
jgi:hypothetical protein